MRFHLGKPVLVMIVLAAIGGAAVVFEPPRPRADLTAWVFADTHARAYRDLASLYRQRTGKSVDVELVTSKALDVRLTSLFMSRDTAREVPDVAEVEINSIGRYFRPPVEDVGFLPLNSYLQRSGLLRDIVPNRLATWSKDGVIFGVPHDVHPVTITYRDDLFREAGIDLASALTWPEFQDKCLAFQQYWAGRGMRYRHAMELHEGNADDLAVMMLQRHVNLIDQHNVVHLDDPKVLQTLLFYVQLVTGPGRIGAASSSGISGAWAQDVIDGNLCALFTADWRADYVRDQAGALAGKVRMMPLPRFDPDDAPTSTWGGTMIGIPRGCKNPDAAWKLIEFLYFSPEGLASRFHETHILPAVTSEWAKPVYHQPDPFFGGQKVFELYTDLARQIPPHYVTPATALATAELSYVVNRAVGYARDHGTDGLEESCRRWLAATADDTRRRMAHADFRPE